MGLNNNKAVRQRKTKAMKNREEEDSLFLIGKGMFSPDTCFRAKDSK